MAAFYTVSDLSVGHWTDREGNSLKAGRKKRRKYL